MQDGSTGMLESPYLRTEAGQMQWWPLAPPELALRTANGGPRMFKP